MSSTAHKRILVVDDEPLVCAAICLALKCEGHQVEQAHSGEDALAKFDAGTFDVVLTDFTMPGMQGDELAREIKTRDHSKPIIMITGFPPPRTPPEIASVILKPFNLQDLRLALAAVAA